MPYARQRLMLCAVTLGDEYTVSHIASVPDANAASTAENSSHNSCCTMLMWCLLNGVRSGFSHSVIANTCQHGVSADVCHALQQ